MLLLSTSDLPDNSWADLWSLVFDLSLDCLVLIRAEVIGLSKITVQSIDIPQGDDELMSPAGKAPVYGIDRPRELHPPPPPPVVRYYTFRILKKS